MSDFVPAIDRAYQLGEVGRAEYALFSTLRPPVPADVENIESLLLAATRAGDDVVGAVAAVMADTLEASLLFVMDAGIPGSVSDEYKLLAERLRHMSRVRGNIAIVTRAVSTILRQPDSAIYCSNSTVRVSAVD